MLPPYGGIKICILLVSDVVVVVAEVVLVVVVKAKAMRDFYIAHLTGKADQPRFTIIGSGS